MTHTPLGIYMRQLINDYVPQRELLDSIETMDVNDMDQYMGKLLKAYEENYTDVIRALFKKKVDSLPKKNIFLIQIEIAMIQYVRLDKKKVSNYLDILKEIFMPYLGEDLFFEYFKENYRRILENQ